MKLGDLYKKIIQVGIDNDPRGKDLIRKLLKKEKEKFKKLSKDEKIYFDQETLTNPYSDTRILYGDEDTEASSILVGIDMETPEILLADRLREKGTPIDLVMAHHPEGRGILGLHKVMYMQADIFHRFGVPIRIAEGLLSERISEVERRILPGNATRAVDAARLLDIPFFCTHTPADNCVATYLQERIDGVDPSYLSDVMDVLLSIPPYQDSRKIGAGPKIVTGSKENRCGKVFVDMTGGTGGPKNIFKNLAEAQIGTIVGMHIGEEHLKKAKENHINVIIAGHMASDTIGMNLLLDKALGGEKTTIIASSGFRKYEI